MRPAGAASVSRKPIWFGVWSANEVSGGRFVALTATYQGTIIARKTAKFYSVYITNMPEYGTGGTSAPDEQFLYNAIIFPATG